jgi:hypothetical protein
MSLRRRLFIPVVTALLPVVAIEAYNQVRMRTERGYPLERLCVRWEPPSVAL